jgi:AraC-like DNA-binding protein
MILRHFPGYGDDSFAAADFSCFHRENVIVHAKSSDVAYSRHTAPLSVKTCLAGAEIYELNGVPIAVKPGKYLVVNGEQEYASYILSHQEVESFCVFFEDNLASEVLAAFSRSHNQLLDTPETVAPTPFFQNLRPVNTSLVANLQTAVRQGFPAQMWVDEQANFVLAALLREQRRTLRETESLPLARPATRIEIYRRLSLAKDYIASCYAEPLSLKQLARVACLSQHHFLRLFKTAFRQTPYQYLTAVRLEKARRLVMESGDSITDICFAVGFENPSSFARLFRSRFGQSPTDLRRAVAH